MKKNESIKTKNDKMGYRANKPETVAVAKKALKKGKVPMKAKGC